MAVTAPSLLSRRSPLADAARQRETLGGLSIAREFDAALESCGLSPLRPTSIDVLQVNVGKLCNQTCRHCHVDAGPDRREQMTRETMELCLDVIRRAGIPTVDITGGAPELNPHFRWFVEACRDLDCHVMDRCNLTVIETNPYHDLPEFFARHHVELVCSLPHHRRAPTDSQRGDGVYDGSIRALQRLNAAGYGRGNGLRLVLVTNPVGAFLPANQASLASEWKRELHREHGVTFDDLYCIANMPISRFLEWLMQSGNLNAYMERLVNMFNPLAARGVMCRNMISVGWDGTLYDCDFNQMLELPVAPRRSRHIRDFDAAALRSREIVVGRHCFGCTAGAGSSCGGATA